MENILPQPVYFNINLKILTLLSLNNSETQAIGQTLADSINEVFVKKEIKFNFILTDDKDNLKDIFEETVKRSDGNFAYKLYTGVFSEKYEHRDSHVMLTNEKQKLSATYSAVDYVNDSMNAPTHLIYCDQMQLKDFDQSMLTNSPIYINSLGKFMNNYFIMNSHNGYHLTTIFIVDNKELMQNAYALGSVNIFNKKSFKWMGNFEALKHKLTKFNKFDLFVYIVMNTREECYIDENGKIQGIIIEILNLVKKQYKLNIIFQCTVLIHGQRAYAAHYNLDLKPTFGFIDGVTLGIDTLRTTTYGEKKYHLVITPVESYTSYEKLIMPFDKATWIFLIVTFLFSFVTIVVVNQFSRNVQDLIYGVNVQMPGYNIISIFFGIGQTQLPTSNFPRFILTLFICFCLIFRTAYQGVLYELITTDVQKPLPETFTHLLQQNYNFYGQFNLRSHKIISFLNETSIAVTNNDIKIEVKNYDGIGFAYTHAENYQNTSAKLAFLVDDEELMEFTLKCNCSSIILKDTLFHYQMSLLLDRNNFFFNMIEETLQKIIPFGIPQHTEEYTKWLLYDHHLNLESDSGPKVLTLEGLSFGFVLWLAACGISFLGFVYELMHIKLRRHMRTFIGLVLFLLLLNCRLKTCAYL